MIHKKISKEEYDQEGKRRMVARKIKRAKRSVERKAEKKRRGYYCSACGHYHFPEQDDW